MLTPVVITVIVIEMDSPSPSLLPFRASHFCQSSVIIAVGCPRLSRVSRVVTGALRGRCRASRGRCHGRVGECRGVSRVVAGIAGCHGRVAGSLQAIAFAENKGESRVVFEGGLLRRLRGRQS